MLWLWILLALAALVLLLCRTRVGMQAAFDGDTATVDLRVGVFRMRVLPGKEKKEKKPRKAAKKPAGEDAKPGKGLPKPSLADIRSAIQALWPPLRRALRRTRRGIRVKPLTASVTLAGREDPAASAELYGKLQAAVWTVMPALEQLVDIPDPHIHVGVDFDTDQTALTGEAGVTMRIGTLIAVGLGIAIPALRWFMWFKKQHTAPDTAKKSEATPPAQTAA